MRLQILLSLCAVVVLAVSGCLTPKVKFGVNPVTGTWFAESAKEDDLSILGMKVGWGGGGDPNINPTGKGGYAHADSIVISSKGVPVIDANTRLNAQYGANSEIILAKLEAILGTDGIRALLYGGANRLQGVLPQNAVPYIPEATISPEEQTKKVEATMQMIESILRDPVLTVETKESRALSLCEQTPGCPVEYVKGLIAQMKAALQPKPEPTTQPTSDAGRVRDGTDALTAAQKIIEHPQLRPGLFALLKQYGYTVVAAIDAKPARHLASDVIR